MVKKEHSYHKECRYKNRNYYPISSVGLIDVMSALIDLDVDEPETRQSTDDKMIDYIKQSNDKRRSNDDLRYKDCPQDVTDEIKNMANYYHVEDTALFLPVYALQAPYQEKKEEYETYHIRFDIK